jgi:hypothetical protein
MSILATKEISMSKVSSIENPAEVEGEYRGQALTVEPHGIEQVSASERHGRPRALFTLWLSANMGCPSGWSEHWQSSWASVLLMA